MRAGFNGGKNALQRAPEAVRLAPEGTVRLVARTDPFSWSADRRIDRVLEPGGTIAEILSEAGAWPPPGSQARVLLDDQVSPRALWHRVRPKHGHVLTLCLVPQDPGGDDGGKSPLGIVLTIALLAATIAVPQFGVVTVFGFEFALGTALVQAGIGIGNVMWSSKIGHFSKLHSPSPRIPSGWCSLGKNAGVGCCRTFRCSRSHRL